MTGGWRCAGVPEFAGIEELPGVGVAHRGAFTDAEHDGQVQGVRAVVEGFFELPVHADLFEGDARSSQPFRQPVFADGPLIVAGLFAEEQVLVEGVRPALVPIDQVLNDQGGGQIVEPAGVAVDRDPPVRPAARCRWLGAGST
ncbi:hypothetical protein [Dactylosporangium sp. NPDC005555]|uniref:hypothetical protein n=1 Tax=Dactylosporangium sp. NPDC005555 TaxID=3154889 RepID=UPI0033A8F35E